MELKGELQINSVIMQEKSEYLKKKSTCYSHVRYLLYL